MTDATGAVLLDWTITSGVPRPSTEVPIVNYAHDDRVAPAADEPVVVKEAPNAFVGTGLEQPLRSEGVDRVVVAGMMTSMCVDATVRAAVDLGFAVTVVGDPAPPRTSSMQASTCPGSRFMQPLWQRSPTGMPRWWTQPRSRPRRSSVHIARVIDLEKWGTYATIAGGVAAGLAGLLSSRSRSRPT